MRISDWSSDVCSSDLRKSSLQATVRDAERQHFEVIAMHALVIPRRARTVVAEIATFHRRIAREPAGVIVESLLAAVRTARCRLAMGDNAGTARTDRKSTRLNSSH